MQSTNEIAEVNQAQLTYARLAGILMLGAIIIAIGGGAILSNIAGNGNFAETGRPDCSIGTSISTSAFERVDGDFEQHSPCLPLYATLKPVNSLLAQLGMIFSLGDSFLAQIVRMCSFVRLHLYISARGTGAASIPGELLSDLIRTIAGTTENIGGISFGLRNDVCESCSAC